MVPDIFEYEGPLDLTEYYVRRTELRSESGDLLRVEVEDRQIIRGYYLIFLYRL